MLPLATQNSLLVEWLVPFQVGFPPTLFQALAGRTACQQCAADFAARFLYNFNSACQEHPVRHRYSIFRPLFCFYYTPVGYRHTENSMVKYYKKGATDRRLSPYLFNRLKRSPKS